MVLPVPPTPGRFVNAALKLKRPLPRFTPYSVNCRRRTSPPNFQVFLPEVNVTLSEYWKVFVRRRIGIVRLAPMPAKLAGETTGSVDWKELVLALGIPSALLIFPGEGHSLDKNPWHGKIKVREELKWLQKYGGV